ncbi:MAG: hypothetical protein JWR18_2693 [Segetibacter sp.]|jgi:hypothetical protein|nr:hypothetical protein [Segetibacter sp.]
MESLVKQKPTVHWTERMIEGEELFTATRIAKSDKILDTYLFNLSKAKETSEIWKAIEIVTKAFDKLNMDDDGFIESSEREELSGFIKYAAETYGLKYEGDVTEEYRLEW